MREAVGEEVRRRKKGKGKGGQGVEVRERGGRAKERGGRAKERGKRRETGVQSSAGIEGLVRLPRKN